MIFLFWFVFIDYAENCIDELIFDKWNRLMNKNKIKFQSCVQVEVKNAKLKINSI